MLGCCCCTYLALEASDSRANIKGLRGMEMGLQQSAEILGSVMDKSDRRVPADCRQSTSEGAASNKSASVPQFCHTKALRLCSQGFVAAEAFFVLQLRFSKVCRMSKAKPP